MDMANLTWLHGRPQSTGVLKANPEDFVVVEDRALRRTVKASTSG